MNNKKSVAIVGAGIAGLALAFLLKKSGVEPTLFEKSGRAGGWIKTERVGGFLFELGARSCRTTGNGLYTLRMIEELQMEKELIAAAAAAKRRFLFCDGKLQQLPSSPLAFLTSPLTRPLLLPLLLEPFRARAKNDDETIISFAKRRLGSYAAARFFDPMTSGIYGGDIEALSISSCFPELKRWEMERGSLLLGALARKRRPPPPSPFVAAWQREPLFTLKRGMQSLTDRLEEELKNNLIKNVTIDAIAADENGVTLVIEGSEKRFDRAALAIPSEELKHYFPSAPTVERASLATASIGYKEDLLLQKGFGHLIPTGEKLETLGTVWDSSAFPAQNLAKIETRLTVMMGGAKRPDIAHLPEKRLETIALDAVKRELSITATPAAIAINYAKEAIPQYHPGHLQRVEAFEKTLPNTLHLLGNSFRGVALNDAISSAYKIAGEIGRIFREGRSTYSR